MKGREEHKYKSESKMRALLRDKPQYFTGYYNGLFNSCEYLTAQNYTMTAVRFMNYLKENGFIESLEDCIGAMTIDNVNSYLSCLRGRDGGYSSDSAKATTYTALKSFADYLLSRKMISENPFDCGIKRVSVKDPLKQVAMTAAELKKVVERINDNSIGTKRANARREAWKERNLAIFTLLMVTGIRVTALTELNMEDILWDQKIIRVTDKRRNTYECELDDDSMDILRNWVVKRAELLNKRDCNALFISNRRTRITDKSVRDLVKAYTADFEKHITPHKFRSTFATLLYDQTGDIAYVQQLMNHSRPDTTQRYIVRKPINAEAAKYVNSLLK